MNNLDNLLPRGEAFEHFPAKSLFPYPLNEVLDYFEIDVGFKKRKPDLLQGGVDVLFLISPCKLLKTDSSFSLILSNIRGAFLFWRRRSFRNHPNSPYTIL
jgi:hypothetical protein